ncbi:P-loop containing nucleoside triphosphate hydrolase protein [Mycena maculata]|uniref:P-loop containing nucleoside triphosphate hydrolase protein n=1 Tax=Mycena maculata TaxID=230809 RepID=A0AAD7NYW2_9AGAR|nr:P-loop containing nucleoside triphosphate hydrolase protein [Mycena maculata]
MPLLNSLTSQSSLEEVDSFRQEIRRIKGPDSPIVVVGTKRDLASEREVSAKTIESLAKSWDLPFYETSAKHNRNVNDPFEDLVRQMRRRILPPVGREDRKKQKRGECITM